MLGKFGLKFLQSLEPCAFMNLNKWSGFEGFFFVGFDECDQ
jgi:hypothetical protein